MHGNSYHPLLFLKSPATLPTAYVSPYCKMHGPCEPVLWHTSPNSLVLLLLPPSPGPHPYSSLGVAVWEYCEGSAAGTGGVTLASLAASTRNSGERIPGALFPAHPNQAWPSGYRVPCGACSFVSNFSFLLLPTLTAPRGITPRKTHMPQSCLRHAPRRCQLTS